MMGIVLDFFFLFSFDTNEHKFHCIVKIQRASAEHGLEGLEVRRLD
jgi:hypothetical protein